MLKGAERVEALVDADLFVLPSRQENFGIVVAEAMAAGVPVIISDQVNLHGEVTSSAAGEAVPLDVGSLADALTRWIADPAKRAEAGRHGRAHALANWDWNVIARRWVAQYEALTAPHVSP
jgi:glycosyltransferase involved in cell wall biosynthesis